MLVRWMNAMIALGLSGWLICATASAQPAAGGDAPAPLGPIPNEAPGGPVPIVTAPATGNTARPAPAKPTPPKPASAKPAVTAPPVPTTSGANSPSPASPASQSTNPGLDQPAAAQPAPPASSSPATPINPAETVSPAPHSSAPRTRGIGADRLFIPAVATIGAGSAVLLASLFTGIGAHGIYNALERDCKNDVCPSTAQNKLDSGKTLAAVSTVLTGVGIVAVGVGTALLIIAARRTTDGDTEHAHLQWTPGPTPLGVGARASF